jgi:hypothetical protein
MSEVNKSQPDEESKIDYLEVDNNIPGQNYVCLSFLSPESLIKDKGAFDCAKFLQSYCKEEKLKFDDVYNKYKDFTYKYEEQLQRDFDEKNNFQTSLRGIKVRGVFDTRGAADDHAKKLSVSDSSFHVFIGQVGYWLPWDPNADKVSNEVFQNGQLNEMMEKYEENNINRDMFYEEQKREKVKAAKEEVLRAKLEEEKLKEEEETVYDLEPEPEPESIEYAEPDASEPEPDASEPEPDASEPETDASEPEPEPETGPEPEPEPETGPEPESEPDASESDASEPETDASDPDASEPEPEPEPDASEPEPEPEPDASEPEPGPDASEPEPEPDASESDASESEKIKSLEKSPITSDNVVDESLKNTLDSEDPWLQRKAEGSKKE